MGSIWIAMLVLLTLVFIFRKRQKYKKNLPPGPMSLPILGHFHLLGHSPHLDLQKLAQKHGPIMCMRFGSVNNIVVSSSDAAEQFLKTHDIVFSSRPPSEVAKYILYEHKSITFAPYGPYWRSMRKMCISELLSNQKVMSFQSMRKEELQLFVNFIKQSAQDRIAVDLSEKLSSIGADMSCRMVFGKKYDEKEFSDRGFRAIVKEGLHVAAIPNLGDYFPYLRALDIQGLTRRMKHVSKVCDNFFEKIIDEHVKAKVTASKEQTKDFVDMLLALMNSKDAEFQIDRRHVKAIMLDMLFTSMDTSSTAAEWVMADLFKHPITMKKLQNELHEVVGLDKTVDESDLDKLTYLDMIIKESFRLHPVAPLLLPHLSTKDCTINGFFIPKNARIIINVHAIGRDPNVWLEAEKFIPERFSNIDVDLRGRDFRILPFGSGRRICPGIQLGLTVVKLMVAQLAHCFDWELPNKMLPEELDMTANFGLTTTRAKNLLAIPTFRLKTT